MNDKMEEVCYFNDFSNAYLLDIILVWHVEDILVSDAGSAQGMLKVLIYVCIWL